MSATQGAFIATGRTATSDLICIAPQASSDAGIIDLWLDTHRSPATRKGYAIDIRALRAFTVLPLRSITIRDLQAFAASLDHLAPATICRRLAAVKSLFKLAHRLGYLQFDVAAPIPLPTIRDTLAERVLSEWDVQRMLAREPKARNAALLRLLYGAGLRISEPCALRWRDLTPRDDAGQVTILGKGGKTRFILLSAPLWTRLTALRGASGPDSPVFRSRHGLPLSKAQVHRIVKAAARRAGLSSAVSAHFLRHSACSHALDRGCAVHVVQTSLGHASLSTTTRYSHARPNDSISRYLNA